jgi:hypothetical protein
MSSALSSVFAGSSAELRTSYTDKDNVPATPAALSYRIINPVSGTEIRSPTSVGGELSSTVDIPLNPADHIMSAGVTNERRRVIVTATYGVDDVLIGVYDYLVLSTTASIYDGNRR